MQYIVLKSTIMMNVIPWTKEAFLLVLFIYVITPLVMAVLGNWISDLIKKYNENRTQKKKQEAEKNERHNEALIKLGSEDILVYNVLLHYNTRLRIRLLLWSIVLLFGYMMLMFASVLTIFKDLQSSILTSRIIQIALVLLIAFIYYQMVSITIQINRDNKVLYPLLKLHINDKLDK